MPKGAPDFHKTIRHLIPEYITPVIRPEIVGREISELKVGVGTPFVIEDPDTLEKYLLFTGWSREDGKERSIWVAEITSDFKVTNYKRILTSADFGVERLAAVHTFWDDYNEQWVITTSTVNPNKAVVAFLDKEFNLVSTQDLTLSRTPKDSGVSPVPLGNKKLLLAYASRDAGALDQVWLEKIEDLTTRPYPSTTDLGMITWHGRPDVLQFMILNGIPMVFYEDNFRRDIWILRMGFGPEIETTYLDTTDLSGQFFLLSSPRPIIPIDLSHQIPHFGHPHFTALLGRPILFFIWFKCWNLGGTRAFRHGIFAYETPRDFLLPERWFPLTGCVLKSPGTSKGVGTFGAKSAIIQVRATELGTLKIQEAQHVGALVGGWYVETTKSIGAAGFYKFVIEDPLPCLRVEADFDGHIWVTLK